MSNQQQNRFLLPASSANSAAAAAANNSTNNTTRQESSSSSANSSSSKTTNQDNNNQQDQENQLSVDTDFDSYWEEEARNPHRNRIRIGRQYQATVPGLLKPGERDRRKLEELETLSFCPKRSAKVSDAELDHYFTVAKSLNLFASLVETRSLLGRDVTIADLNHIRRKEGLSLASVIQQPPVRQAAISAASSLSSSANQQQQQQQQQQQSPQHSQQHQQQSMNSNNNQSSASPQKSPAAGSESSSSAVAAGSPREPTLNQPLMKALSHFISLHHPCHHDANCKKLQKDLPFEDDSRPAVSITAGNLRQQGSALSASSSSSNAAAGKPGRSRSSLKQQQAQAAKAASAKDQPDQQEQKANDTTSTDQQNQQSGGDSSAQSPSIEDWTREEVELFSKAIEVCGKNFKTIKKDFLPSKSVKSIVEYYYIGSRDLSDNKKQKQPSQQQANLDQAGDTCSSPEKSQATNNNGGQGGGGGPSISGKPSGGGTAGATAISNANNNQSSSSSRNSANTDSTSQKKSADHHSSSAGGETDRASVVGQSSNVPIKLEPNLKQGSKHTTPATDNTRTSNGAAPSQNIDARLSVYNFDDEFKDETPVPQLECPKPGAEVRPLKAKPIIPSASAESDANNSNVGSLKFFMDGQLVLKLNACQDQQEGAEKCHWVQSGDRHASANRQKRYTKRSSSEKGNPPSTVDANQNGSKSNSVASSYQDDDSKNNNDNDDLSGADDDSKESMNSSFTNSSAQARSNNNNQASPNSKRLKVSAGGDTNLAHAQQQQQQQQLPSPVDYNRLALNNRMKERNDSISRSNSAAAISQAMPWLQANSFAMAAALLGGLPFPPATANMIQETQNIANTISSGNNIIMNNNNNNNTLNSKPMDLSVEHHHSPPPKALPKSTSRSRSRPKHN